MALCKDGPEQDGRCIVHAGGEFDGRGNQCHIARAHAEAIKQSPFTRRALAGKLPAKVL